MANVPLCGVATVAGSHLALKIFPVLIQYFDWGKRWIANSTTGCSE
jgi:hypothetical protein